MPDIAMCANEQCEKRKQCYRFNAKPNEPYQNYGRFRLDDKGECKYFVDMKDRKDV